MTQNSYPLKQNAVHPGAEAISSTSRLGSGQPTPNDNMGIIQDVRQHPASASTTGVAFHADVHPATTIAVPVEPDEDSHDNSMQRKVFHSLNRIAMVGLLLTVSIIAAVVAFSVLLTRPVTSLVVTLPSSLSPKLSLLPSETPLFNPTSSPSTASFGLAAENSFDNQTVMVEPSTPPSKATLSPEPSALPSITTMSVKPSALLSQATVTDEPTALPSQVTITDESSAKLSGAPVTDESTAKPSVATITDAPITETPAPIPALFITDAPITETPAPISASFITGAPTSALSITGAPISAPTSALSITGAPISAPSQVTITVEPSAKPSKATCVVSSSTEARVCLLLDSSGSIIESNFQLSLNFSQGLVSAIDTKSPDSLYSIVLFASDAIIQLNYSDATTTLDELATLTRDYYRGTATQLGFEKCQATFDLGDGKSHVIIILTNGSPNDSSLADSTANATKATGTKIVCLGIGSGIDFETLSRWSTIPELTFQAKSFADLENIASSFTSTISCA